MPDQNKDKAVQDLIDALNEDLSREYQAIIAYVNYSQVLKGAAYMNIAAELEKHAAEELNHALIIARSKSASAGVRTATALVSGLSAGAQMALARRLTR